MPRLRIDGVTCVRTDGGTIAPFAAVGIVDVAFFAAVLKLAGLDPKLYGRILAQDPIHVDHQVLCDYRSAAFHQGPPLHVSTELGSVHTL